MLTAWETNRNAICSKFMNRWRARLFQSIKRKHSTTSTGISWTEFLKRWNLVLNFEPWSGVYTRTFKVPFCRTVCVGVLQRRTGYASRIPLIASSVCSSCRSVGQAIRKSSEIQGFRVPGGREVKISQYADDNTCIVTNSYGTVKVIDVINEYGTASGARLNVTKSKGLWLGRWKSRTDSPCSLVWINTCLKNCWSLFWQRRRAL